MECCNQKSFDKAKPFIAVVFLQFGYAGMDILSKVALNKGMSNYVLVVYRHAVAFIVIAPFALLLEKKVRPKMTLSIFMKLVALSVLEPVIDQNLYFLGMKYTTATFAVSMFNVLPAITFVMACLLKNARYFSRWLPPIRNAHHAFMIPPIFCCCVPFKRGLLLLRSFLFSVSLRFFINKTLPNFIPAFVDFTLKRIEKIKMKSIHSQAKVVGTIATVAGAMVMTLIKGPVLHLFGAQGNSSQSQHNNGEVDLQHAIKGSIMITIGCVSCASFMILQAITLETYPAELSLTAWICLLGTIEGGIVGLIMERGEPSVWSLNWDTKLLAAVYSGIVCSGMAYYIQGAVMKYRGPVFVTTFNPLCMVIVAIMGSFFLAEKTYLGRVIGAVVIILGLYLVVWGKSKDYDDTPSPIVKEHILPATQTTEINKKEEHSNHEVINTSSNFGAARDEHV